MNIDTKKCLKKLGELKKGDSVWLSFGKEYCYGYRPKMLVDRLKVIGIHPYISNPATTVVQLDHPIVHSIFIEKHLMGESKLYNDFWNIMIYATPTKELKDWFKIRRREFFDPLYIEYDNTGDDNLEKEIIETEQEWEEYEQNLW